LPKCDGTEAFSLREGYKMRALHRSCDRNGTYGITKHAYTHTAVQEVLVDDRRMNKAIKPPKPEKTTTRNQPRTHDHICVCVFQVT